MTYNKKYGSNSERSSSMNWKILALGLSSLIGVGAVVGTTVVVMKHHEAAVQQQALTPPQAAQQASAPGSSQADEEAAHMREVRADCRQVAQSKVKERTGEVLKDVAIGALIGAGTGSAGGAI